MRAPWYILFLSLVVVEAGAQAVDNMSSVRMLDSKRYVRLHYENDFFTGHDLYYTQGVNLELVNPAYGKIFLMKLLVRPARASHNFGIALEHNAYTPSSITHPEILYGDRPFTANLFVKMFSFGDDSVRKIRYTSSFSFGVIGSIASGYFIQKTIHGWLDTTPPKGWENQIANDLVLNYEAGIEKNILRLGNSTVVNLRGTGKIGTLSDKLTASAVLMSGRLNPAINSAFGNHSMQRKRKTFFHFYVEPMINLVGYDATMQGGVFNRSSPYTLSASSINRITLQISYGIVFQYHAISAEYFKSAITEEFKGSDKHRWGGIRFAARL